MTLLALLPPHQRTRLAQLCAQVATSGVLLAAIIPIVNYGVLRQPDTTLFTALAFASVSLLIMALWLRRSSAEATAGLLEDELCVLRKELLGRIQAADLRQIEARPSLHAELIRDLEALDKAAHATVYTLHYAVVMVFLAGYVFIISPSACLLWCGIIAGLGSLIVPEIRRNAATIGTLNKQRVELYQHTDRMLRAFRQFKLDPLASVAITAELNEMARVIAQHRIAVDRGSRVVLVHGSVLFLFGIGLFLFGLPEPLGLAPALTYELVIILFMTTIPATLLLLEVRTFVAAALAAENILTLREAFPITSSPTRPPPQSFEAISLSEVTFAYGPPHDPGFSVGPLDLELRPGEVTFLTGSNGSGKTTIMKLIAGLYSPTGGRVTLNGQFLNGATQDSYRALFTTIFTDQHLFERLYGIDAEPSKVNALLQRFALEKVTQFVDGRFTNLDLSSGQRKRLSMVVAILEARPICLLDEWAAHQDPQLRRYYYEQLIPELSAKGHTVIAVSHDDRFFHTADRVLHIESGRIDEVTR